MFWKGGNKSRTVVQEVCDEQLLHFIVNGQCVQALLHNSHTTQQIRPINNFVSRCNTSSSIFTVAVYFCFACKVINHFIFLYHLFITAVVFPERPVLDDLKHHHRNHPVTFQTVQFTWRGQASQFISFFFFFLSNGSVGLDFELISKILWKQ